MLAGHLWWTYLGPVFQVCTPKMNCSFQGLSPKTFGGVWILILGTFLCFYVRDSFVGGFELENPSKYAHDSCHSSLKSKKTWKNSIEANPIIQNTKQNTDCQHTNSSSSLSFNIPNYTKCTQAVTAAAMVRHRRLKNYQPFSVGCSWPLQR